MKLILATRNQHKVMEISKILRFPEVEFVSTLDFPDLPEIVEDGNTFEANAIKKATTIARLTQLWALADDSGLEVDALNGEPGVYSARFAGKNATDDDNNAKLLNLLSSTSDRIARFRCVLALADPGGNTKVVDGVCEGYIMSEACGQSGFGYDPLFVPNGYTKSFAELGSEIKNQISHRADALNKARIEWADLLSK